MITDLFTQPSPMYLDIRMPIEPTSRNGLALLNALRAGHRLTPLTSPAICGIVALSQEVGRLKKLGHPVRSRMVKTASGKRISEYFI